MERFTIAGSKWEVVPVRRREYQRSEREASSCNQGLPSFLYSKRPHIVNSITYSMVECMTCIAVSARFIVSFDRARQCHHRMIEVKNITGRMKQNKLKGCTGWLGLARLNESSNLQESATMAVKVHLCLTSFYTSNKESRTRT